MRLRVESDAEEELTAAAEWYESRRAGLGVELVAVIDGALEVSCVRDDASASAMGAHAVAAEGTDEGTNQRDDAGARDAAPRDGGERRDDAGDLGPNDRESPARRSGAAHVAPGNALC